MRQMRALVAAAALAWSLAAAAQTPAATDLEGLWVARNGYAQTSGPLLLLEHDGGFGADIAGFRVPVSTGKTLSFELPDAFSAGGNGGQVSIGIPELDLAITFTGGNYADHVLFRSGQVYVPEYLLPAVR